MTSKQMTTTRKATPRKARLIGLVLALMVVLAACGSGTGTQQQGDTDPVKLSDATFAENPKEYVGPSTAVMTNNVVRPVADNPKPQLPVTVTDAQGTVTTVTDVSRILAIDLYGTASRTVYELGLGDNVVGRDTSSGFPGIEDKPVVTQNGHNLNAEAILELAPTVIITDTSLGPWDVMLQMRDAGIPVIAVDSKRDIDSTEEFTMQVAEALGVPDEGRKLVERIQSETTEVLEEIDQYVPKDDSERLRMMFLYVRGQAGVYYIFGPGSGTDSLIEGIGGIDVASDIGWEGMQPMTDEAIVEAQPDLVLMMTLGLDSVGGVDGLLEAVPALKHTPAGQKKRIVDMSDYEVMSFGPNTPGVLEALAIAVYAPETKVPPSPLCGVRIDCGGE
ncbi:heme/hemin ABC transporter substrate-binding protein [Trueperella bialowiezensis]|uniref:Hemin-binding periplasmic protein hmuT n=1 Tax=Trueperella bialowiezensis TaxID=312285 RepID=A0A3S4WGE2_9ACTO|nr:ABC transporter substrate-binding protein [Trueperella bialowiezensis]VEI13323.1 Hemin-binding periplasmic protein hmuT precursor [Trueperella bialowiezensis]